MGFVHGKNANITLDDNDLSAFASKVEFEVEAEAHDTTTFGKAFKNYSGGLKDGTVSVEGIYDGTATTGPRAVIEPMLGTTVECVYAPEGTGTGRTVRTFDVVVTKYKESAPVADMITWTCELQMSEDPVITTGV